MRYLALLLALLGGGAAAFEVRVRDSDTGAPVVAQLALSPAGPAASARLPWSGQAAATDLALAVGSWQLHASAPGYVPLSTTLAVETNSSGITVQLDPRHESAELQLTRQRVERDPTSALLHGYVRQSFDAAAVANAQVRIASAGVVTQTDSQGYFVLALPTTDATTPYAIEIRAPGQPLSVREGLLASAGASRILVLLDSARPRQTLILPQPLRAREPRQQPSTGADGGAVSTPSAVASVLAPPATIRVGFNDAGCSTSCCGTSCSHVCAFSLETYVRRGLDSEWIASWNTQSLRAGSLAYRSYGAWHVTHPRTASYDICSSACCQVNDAVTHSATDAAIARTPGLLLTRDTLEPYRAEYSAENNSWDDPADGLACSNADLSCGNGFVGSPATGWPCLGDTVAAGRGCFGHGRGMSQWGSQRWAIAAPAQRWKWIANHYYNDNGNANGAGTGQRTATITSPLRLDSVSATPASLAAGTSLALALQISNLAGATHSHLLLGASLYRSGVGYVSDPAHDALLVLPTGSTAAGRAFDVPAATPAGAYDLLVALYLDVDENGLISSEDLALTSLSQAQAVTVFDDGLFADGFGG